MQGNNVENINNGFIKYYKTDKFKRNLLVMSLILPISKQNTKYDVVIPSILLRGTEKHKTFADISKYTDDLFGTSIDISQSYIGDGLMLNIYADFLNSDYIDADFDILDKITELLSEIWLRPKKNAMSKFSIKEIMICRRSVIDSINEVKNDMPSYSSKRLREIMYENEPYGYSINEDDINKLNMFNLTDRYNDIVKNTAVSFFYIGNADKSKVESTICKYFDADNCNKILIPKLGSSINKEIKRYNEALPVNQSNLAMGFYTGNITLSDNRYYDQLIAVSILGGSPVSKLFMNVREKMSLCYSCGARYDKFKGAVYIFSGVSPENTKSAEEAICEQINIMREGKITDKELYAAKEDLVNYAKQIEDMPYALWSYYSVRTLFGIDCELEDHIDKINNVKIEGVIDAINAWTESTVFCIDGTEKLYEK